LRPLGVTEASGGGHEDLIEAFHSFAYGIGYVQLHQDVAQRFADSVDRAE